MIHIDSLKSRGFSNEVLKRIFTSKAPAEPARRKKGKSFKGEEAVPNEQTDPTQATQAYQLKPGDKSDFSIRQMFERRIKARLDEAWRHCIDTYQLWAPVDMAWDSPPVSESNLPLMLLASGKIALNDVAQQIAAIERKTGSQLIERDKEGKPLRVNMPKFFEVSHNLLKQFTTRRVAAIAARYNQYPWLKYDSRFSSQVGRLRADAMTAVADAMADQFGYRHKLTQWIRDQSLYTHCVVFADRSWVEDRQVLPVPASDGLDEMVDNTKDVIVREGLNFVTSHPSRTFYDTAFSVSDINYDIGPGYIGFWDAVRKSAIRNDDSYWNPEEIDTDDSFYDVFKDSQAYFDIYYGKDRISTKRPMSRRFGGNDRKSSVGDESAASEDQTIVIANYYERIIPKKEGIGSYEYPVWVRFVVTGSGKVIFAEIMPSTPAFVVSYNANDSRLLSTSFGHDCLAYQDQISNFLSQMIQIQRQGLTKVIELNTDGMSKEDIDAFKAGIRGDNYYASNTHVLEYSQQKFEALGLSPSGQAHRVNIREISTTEKTNELFSSIMKLMQLAERNLFFSPQEMGQYVTKETTAAEVTAVNTTTLTMHDFHAAGVEEGLAAMKRIIYESKVAMGSNNVLVSVFDRYPINVIERAGFKVVDEDGDPATDDDIRQSDDKKRGTFTLAGGKRCLVYEYCFTSREGMSRSANSQVAQAQMQVLQTALAAPVIVNNTPRDKIADMLNETFRNSGTGFNLNLKFSGDGSQPLGSEEQKAGEIANERATQLQGVIQEVVNALGAIKADQEKAKQETALLARSITSLSEAVKGQLMLSGSFPAGTVPPTAPVR